MTDKTNQQPITHPDPPLTEDAIRRWVGEAAFGRALSYYHGGQILHPRRQGMTLRARCVGTEAQPYRLWVSLDQGGIAAGACSCYVGAGGRCKHVAALLLTWLHRPERFEEQETLEAALEGRSKAALIALIRRMLTRHPELEWLLETPLPEAGEALLPVDEATIEKQVRSAFYGGDDWGPGGVVTEELAALAMLGDAYAKQERWADAATVYRVLLSNVAAVYERFDDEEGALGDLVDACVHGLGRCLKASPDPGLRADPDGGFRAGILRTLFEVYHRDVGHGGIGLGDEAWATLLEEATPREKRYVAGWVRGVMPSRVSPRDDWSLHYQREVYEALLMELEAEDDEAYLRFCREMSRWHDLAARLVDLGRIEAAAALAREQDDAVLLHVAHLLVKAKRGELAETLVRERAAASRDGRLRSWLKTRALERGDRVEALALAEEQFWERPTLGGYEELRQLGSQAGRAAGTWEARRGSILARLGDRGQHELLTEIHLQAGELDRALEALGPVLAAPWGGSDLALRVAQAAEAERPRAALTLYRQQAERAIGGRSRPSYAAAAHLLTRVRTLYDRLGEPEAWQAYVEDLRQAHKRWSALQDEFNKAGIE